MLDVRVAATASSPARRVDTVGRADALRTAAGELTRGLTEPVVLDLHGLGGERLAAYVEGLVLGGHRRKPLPDGLGVELLGVEDAAAVELGRARAAATCWARDLANTPAAVKTPSWLGAEAVGVLAPLGVDVTVRDEQWLTAEGFGGVLAVGAGSANEPRLIEASWRPRGARAGHHLVLVGKGITFDTGGINLKPGSSMRSMHTDMAAGAAALAALRLIAEQRLPIRVTVLVPTAENSFSGASMRPGDVVRHVGGRTSEITNTDAEGRLVLADALAYAVRRLRPTALVDLATLTGAMKIALGLRVGGLFATSDGLARGLLRAGERAGEPLWRLPLAADYTATLDSSIADANNSPGNPGGITAALFLRPFAGDVPWAHLDIAGPARAPKDDGVLTGGGTGFGTRLLARWAETFA